MHHSVRTLCLPFVHFVAALLYLSLIPFSVWDSMWIELYQFLCTLYLLLVRALNEKTASFVIHNAPSEDSDQTAQKRMLI